jgi:hypothetical protein
LTGVTTRRIVCDMARIEDWRSPCRIDKDKGKRRHHCSAAHADLVREFRTHQMLQEVRAEEATKGYATEMALYFDPLNGVERRVTFKDWLIQSADRTRESYE